jgi:Rieske Fe-S protein
MKEQQMANARQDDFPVSWTDDRRVTRRAFTRSLAWASGASFAATAGLALGAGARSPGTQPERRVAGLEELPVGGTRVFDYPSEGVRCLLVRRDSDSFVAFAQSCTHLGCPVIYEHSRNVLECPCHAGLFSAADGRVLAGPPPRPLPRIVLVRRGDEIWATGAMA